MAAVAGEIQRQCEHIENTLKLADQRWKSLERRLTEAEDSFLQQRKTAWKRWFNIEEQDLFNHFPGSVRMGVRERVKELVVHPLFDKMKHRLSYAELPVDPAEGTSALAVILDDFHKRVHPVIKEAKKADVELDKKIRKTERDERKQGH